MSKTAAPPSALTPVPLMEMTTGFWRFKTLAAAVDLGLFSLLAERGDLSLDEIAAALGLEERPARMLLSSCAALDLLVKAGPRYSNSALASEFLVQDGPHYFGGFVQYSDSHGYPAWQRLQEALRTNRPTTWDADAQESAFTTTDPAILDRFWDAMFTISSFTAAALASAHDFSGHTRLLDVGGGMGAFPVGLCRAHPHLRATVFELPHIAEKAQHKIASLGLADRIGAHPGDFINDAALPTGHDTILLSMILHDWDPGTCRALLAKCFAALPPGGSLIICELVLDDSETGPAPAALMGMNMLVETRGGYNYTDGEYRAWLSGAGFTDITSTPLDSAGANAAIIARRL